LETLPYLILVFDYASNVWARGGCCLVEPFSGRLVFWHQSTIIMPRLTWSDLRPQPAAKLFFTITGYEWYVLPYFLVQLYVSF
jgi:hypothetical protein